MLSCLPVHAFKLGKALRFSLTTQTIHTRGGAASHVPPNSPDPILCFPLLFLLPKLFSVTSQKNSLPCSSFPDSPCSSWFVPSYGTSEMVAVVVLAILHTSFSLLPEESNMSLYCYLAKGIGTQMLACWRFSPEGPSQPCGFGHQKPLEVFQGEGGKVCPGSRQTPCTRTSCDVTG